MIIENAGPDTPGLSVYRERREPQLLHMYEPEPGLFIAESALVLERALNAGYRPESLLIERRLMPGLSDLIARCGDVPVYPANEDVIEGIAGYRLTRGVLAAMRRRPPSDAESIVRGASRICVLEDVVNPTNLGAIFRSAAALGMEAVLLTESCTDPFYRRAARVSMGTVFQVPWTYIREPVSSGILERLGFRTAAMALTDDSLPIDDPAVMAEKRLAVVLGSEGPGLKEETIQSCSYRVKIPMSHGVDSLNVAAAAAVMFWQLTRGRSGK